MGNSPSGSLTRSTPRATEHSRVLLSSAAQRRVPPAAMSTTWNVVPSATATARPWERYDDEKAMPWIGPSQSFYPSQPVLGGLSPAR